jgi:hypothetical protein
LRSEIYSRQSRSSTRRIIVTGMRGWKDRARVWRALDVATSNCALSDVVIVEGGAKGADEHARAWAAAKMVRNISYPADWAKYGKSAGMIRNREMARDGANLCLAFWDGKSKGTGAMIATAVENGIPVRICPLARGSAILARERPVRVVDPGLHRDGKHFSGGQLARRFDRCIERLGLGQPGRLKPVPVLSAHHLRSQASASLDAPPRFIWRTHVLQFGQEPFSVSAL